MEVLKPVVRIPVITQIQIKLWFFTESLVFQDFLEMMIRIFQLQIKQLKIL